MTLSYPNPSAEIEAAIAKLEAGGWDYRVPLRRRTRKVDGKPVWPITGVPHG